jgi:hypothetical protein
MRAFGEPQRSGAILRSMTNARELTARLADLLRREHHAMADFLVALADFDRRRVWSKLGHASLFSFLRRELGLSAGAAQYRKTAAELVRKYPQVEAALRDGRLCLSSVIELAKVIAPENAAEVLPRFFGLSSRDAALVAAAIRPVEDAPSRDVVTPLRVPAAAPCAERGSSPQLRDEVAPTLAFRAPETPTPQVSAPATAPASRPPALAKLEVEPLDVERVRLHITASRRFLSKLEAAKDALSHARRGAGTAEVLEACMDLLLAQHAKRKGLVARPRKDPPPAKRDRIPAHVKRAVWIRDGGRCQFRLENGEICGSTVRLEFDHVEPRARGGPSIVENVRLACRPHNQLAARRAFGDAWMDRFTRGAREPAHGAGARPPVAAPPPRL